MGAMLEGLGRGVAGYLTRAAHEHGSAPATSPHRLLSCLQAGDVLLVEGNNRVSTVIKYLTQSTWSHAALFVGDNLAAVGGAAGPHFVEADLQQGVRSVGVEEFAGLHTRICRPVGLTEDECRQVAQFVIARLGYRYDLRNVLDLARYLLPLPPVPLAMRRRLLTLGSGDPTRAICSSLIALAFQSIGYPILPTRRRMEDPDYRECPGCARARLQIRHHSLFTPRDFDVSPYFQIIKPEIDREFDFRMLEWESADAARGAAC